MTMITPGRWVDGHPHFSSEMRTTLPIPATSPREALPLHGFPCTVPRSSIHHNAPAGCNSPSFPTMKDFQGQGCMVR